MTQKDAEQKIQNYLTALKPVPPRTAYAETRGREAFLSQASAIRRAGIPTPQKRNAAGFIPPTRKQTSLTFQGMMAVVLALVIFFSGTGLTVYASQGSLPNQALYQVKLFSEDVILALAGSPQAQMQSALKFADRRVDEIAALVNREILVPGGVVERWQNELNLAISLAAGLDGASMQQQLEQIQLRMEAQLQIVNALMLHSTSDTPLLVHFQARIREQLRLCELGLSDPEGLRLQMQQRQQEHNGWDLTTSPTMQQQNTPQATGTNQWNWNGTPCGAMQSTPSGSTWNTGCGTPTNATANQVTVTPNQGDSDPIGGTPQSGGESGKKP